MAYLGHHGVARHYGGAGMEQHLIEGAVWQRMLRRRDGAGYALSRPGPAAALHQRLLCRDADQPDLGRAWRPCAVCRGGQEAVPPLGHAGRVRPADGLLAACGRAGCAAHRQH